MKRKIPMIRAKVIFENMYGAEWEKTMSFADESELRGFRRAAKLLPISEGCPKIRRIRTAEEREEEAIPVPEYKPTKRGEPRTFEYMGLEFEVAGVARDWEIQYSKLSSRLDAWGVERTVQTFEEEGFFLDTE